jgi:hypothetical protein
MKRAVLISTILCGLIALVMILLAPVSSALTPRPFQSGLPKPNQNPGNSHYYSIVTGGSASCGAAALIIPSGFTEGEGAEIHCDFMHGLSAIPGGREDWEDQGYLVGIYASKLLKPVSLVIELDQARLTGVCSTCLPLRVAVTGKTVSPPLFGSIVALGREETIKRLKNAQTLLNPL